jgi:cysteinyl-tRNA synthetase
VNLFVHNSFSRKKEAFSPIDAKNIRVYLCGPTVYDYAHIGNARPAVVFDILVRLLRHNYGGENVTFVRNITDIDDKIMDRANRDGVSIHEVSTRYADIYNADLAALNVLPPDIEPRATEHLPEMIKMIEGLIAGGFAYEAEGHVLFSTTAMEDYGRLSRHDRDELIAGARVEVAPYKKDATDFVMWKPSSAEQPGWDSPWGRGRPGWHLECSAMIEKHLGETIDIHCGGLDLIFPHHENEIAQSRCAHHRPFVNYWMHNGYLTMSGEKMSKSIGNIRTIHGLLAEFPGEALRLTLLSAHYRGPIDFNGDIVAEQKRRLDRWYRATEGITTGEVPAAMMDALNDDLNTPRALAVLADCEDPSQLWAGARFLGLLSKNSKEWFQGEDSLEIEELIAKRKSAKKSKNFGEADRIRDKLMAMGVVLEDHASGTRWRKE